jgi:hypothetical protein
MRDLLTGVQVQDSPMFLEHIPPKARTPAVTPSATRGLRTWSNHAPCRNNSVFERDQ